jgi:predicted DNA-binding antitoxin AbrB/MazE fold protein
MGLQIDAVYEDGLFRPLEPVELINGQVVKLDVFPQSDEDKELRKAFGDSVRWPDSTSDVDEELEAELSRIADLLAGDKQVSDYIIEDREDRF